MKTKLRNCARMALVLALGLLLFVCAGCSKSKITEMREVTNESQETPNDELASLAASLAGEGEDKAGRAIEKLGGKVQRDETLPGIPVIGVDLADTKVKDTALIHVGEFKNLRSLNLDSTHVTDAGLGLLKQLKNLRVLSLEATDVSDAGLRHLKELPALESLELNINTMITDDGVME
jgi:hypothetical protein